MNYEPTEKKPRNRKEIYDEIFTPILTAIEEPRGGAEYLVALGEDMDRQSETSTEQDKIRSVELLLRNLVNLGNHNPDLFSNTDINPLVVELIESTEAMIGVSNSQSALGDRIAQLQVNYFDADNFRSNTVIEDDYFQKHMAVQAFGFNAADKLALNSDYYRGNIASAVSQVYPTR